MSSSMQRAGCLFLDRLLAISHGTAVSWRGLLQTEGRMDREQVRQLPGESLLGENTIHHNEISRCHSDKDLSSPGVNRAAYA